MKAEIIAVGTEILMGQILNTNTREIAKCLQSLSIGVYYHSVVGDNTDRLTQQLQLATKRSDLIVLCGGLGPTKDDLTKQTLASYLNLSLVLHQKSEEKIRNYFIKKQEVMPNNNLRQCLMIEGSTPLWNEHGFAIGFAITKEKTTYIVLPGPPLELEWMLQNSLFDYLSKTLDGVFTSRILRFTGIGESLLAEKIDTWIEKQSNPTIAIYATHGDVTVRLTANAHDTVKGEQLLDSLETELLTVLNDYFYGYGTQTLPEIVVDLLRKKKQTLSVAESFTGGWFQKELTAIQGVSDVYVGGIVSYQEKAKEALLNVPRHVLDQYGTISRECALSMARGALQACCSDIAIAFTGIADSQAIEGKAAGTIYIAICTKQTENIYPLSLHRTRNMNRETAVIFGFNALRKLLQEEQNGN